MGEVGEKVTLDLRSDEFDTYLIVLCQNGNPVGINYDRADDDTDSRVELKLGVSGKYTVCVTNQEPESKTGDMC